MPVAENIRKGCAAFYGSNGENVAEVDIREEMEVAREQARVNAEANARIDALAENLKSIRTFPTGATRDLDDTKPDYEGFLSPAVLECFAHYMNKHRVQVDGSLRSSDNWQKGMPRDAYMKSGWRHFVDMWKLHRGLTATDNHGPVTIENAICAVLFNLMGYLHEILKEKDLPR